MEISGKLKWTTLTFVMVTCCLDFDTIMFKADTMSCTKPCQQGPPKITDHHFPITRYNTMVEFFLNCVRSLAQTLTQFQLFKQKNNAFVIKYLKIRQKQEILVPCLVLVPYPLPWYGLSLFRSPLQYTRIPLKEFMVIFTGQYLISMVYLVTKETRTPSGHREGSSVLTCCYDNQSKHVSIITIFISVNNPSCSWIPVSFLRKQKFAWIIWSTGPYLFFQVVFLSSRCLATAYLLNSWSMMLFS